MLGRTNTGGGGGGLNFKVIPNPMPRTAKENTIWVDTDKINNYYFLATQPENMVDYDVWFTVGTSSTVAFSATKKNPIMVYPLSAKQYVSGAWVDKTAMSYQNGEWVTWATVLYDNGDEKTTLTGGWVNSKTCNGSITKNTSGMNLNLTGKSSDTWFILNTVNKIDISNSTQIIMDIESVALTTSPAGAAKLYIGLLSTVPTTVPDDTIQTLGVARQSVTTSGSVLLNLGDIPSGSYHVAVFGALWGSSGYSIKGNITKVVMK